MTQLSATNTPVPGPTTDWRFFKLGTIDEAGVLASFRVVEQLLNTHFVTFGGTRTGKSKLFELICRTLAGMGRGFAFIDPHSDTANDLFAYFAAMYDRLGYLQKNLHYLNPAERLFSFDPFVYYPDPDDPHGDSEFSYQNWLNTKIKDMVGIIIRQQGETEDEAQRMVRLKRWMTNALYAVGVRQDAAGTHLPLNDAFALLNPGDERHEELYRRVKPHLSEQVRADFEKLRRTRDARKQEDWVESTVNRLRDILSPLVQRIFNLEAPSIDFHDIIRRGGVILAALGKTTRFHQDEALAIAGLLIRQINEAVRTVRREQRKQYFLLIDEAHNFLGDDLLRMLKESGKFKLSLGLAVQGLDNLQKGDMDLVPAVLGQCSIRITFRQQFHEHADALAKSLCYPMLDFTELFTEVDRHNGYDWYLTPSESHGTGETQSVQFGRSRSHGKSIGVTNGTTKSVQHSKSTATNRSLGIGESSQWNSSHGTSQTDSASHGTSTQHTESASRARSQSSGQGQSEAEGESTTRSHNESANRGTSSSSPTQSTTIQGKGTNNGIAQGSNSSRASSNFSSASESAGQGTSDSVGKNHSISQGRGTSNQFGTGGGDSLNLAVGDSETHSDAQGKARTHSKTHTNTEMEGESVVAGTATSRTHTLTLQLTPLQKVRVELQRTGRLVRSVNDQFAQFAAKISALPTQHCLVAVQAFNRAFLLRVDDVLDPFQARFVSPASKARTIARVKERIFAMHPYYIATNSVPASSTVPPSIPPTSASGSTSQHPTISTPVLHFPAPALQKPHVADPFFPKNGATVATTSTPTPPNQP